MGAEDSSYIRLHIPLLPYASFKVLELEHPLGQKTSHSDHREDSSYWGKNKDLKVLQLKDVSKGNITVLTFKKNKTGQALNTERNPLYLASFWLDEWAVIVNADVQMHDESALSFLERQTESPLFQATALRNLLAILNDMTERGLRAKYRLLPHLQAAMVLLLLSVTVLHLVTLAMLFIATLEKSWWVWTDSEIRDLWYNCFHDNATNTWLCASSIDSDWLQSVQALMVLSVVFSSISFLVFLGQLLTMSKGGLFYFTGLCQAFAGFTAFAACLIFTFHREEILNDSRDLSKGRFGYCFILAWLCVPLLLISGVLYVHLRKKQ